MKDAVQAANITRTHWPADMAEHVNLYLGSGRMGCCFDAFGLMNKGSGGPAEPSISNTQLMHADHWHRGAYGLDSWLPAARLTWRDEQAPPSQYRQTHDLWAGRLTTEMSWPGLKLTVRSCFHPGLRDLLAVELDYHGAMPPLLLCPETSPVTGHYGETVAGAFETISLGNSQWLCRLRAGSADSALALRAVSPVGRVELKAAERGLEVSFPGPAGRHLLLIGLAGWARRAELAEQMDSAGSPQDFAAGAAEAWAARWDGGFVEIPEANYQALWVRSMYYLLASFAPEARSPAPPCGWTNNAWARHFPQDLSCVAAALLRTNRLQEVRCWVEFYRSRLEEMKRFTRDIWKADGAMWAWEFPIGPDAGTMLRDGAPNWCQYEIHNSGYVAFMASQAAMHLGQEEWTRQVAWPIVLESAGFYASALRRGEDGLWGLHLVPSMGQDESGPPDCPDYLDALNSARYCLQAALAMARQLRIELPQADKWRRILADGLAHARLLDAATGVYCTCRTPDGRQVNAIGRQKHPIQLTPLSYLPLGEIDEPTRRAWQMRHQLCQRSGEHEYWGWTLVDMMLASARIGSAEGLLKDLSELQPGRLVDGEWIQIYEGTHKHHRAYYTTSGAWYALALCEALVSDWFGRAETAKACPDEWGEVRFENLRTSDRRLWSGRRAGKRWVINSK